MSKRPFLHNKYERIAGCALTALITTKEALITAGWSIDSEQFYEKSHNLRPFSRVLSGYFPWKAYFTTLLKIRMLIELPSTTWTKTEAGLAFEGAQV